MDWTETNGQPFDYEKEFYSIILLDGTQIDACWPNGGVMMYGDLWFDPKQIKAIAIDRDFLDDYEARLKANDERGIYRLGK